MVLLLDDPLEPVVSPPSLDDGDLGRHRIGSGVRGFTCRSQIHSIPIFDAGVRLYQSMEVYELIHSGRLGSAVSLTAPPRRALAGVPGNQHDPWSLMLSAIAQPARSAARSRTSVFCWSVIVPGWPGPGQGMRSSRTRESVTAVTSWRSPGANCTSVPGAASIVSEAWLLIHSAPLTTVIQAPS